MSEGTPTGTGRRGDDEHIEGGTSTIAPTDRDRLMMTGPMASASLSSLTSTFPYCFQAPTCPTAKRSTIERLRRWSLHNAGYGL